MASLIDELIDETNRRQKARLSRNTAISLGLSVPLLDEGIDDTYLSIDAFRTHEIVKYTTVSQRHKARQLMAVIDDTLYMDMPVVIAPSFNKLRNALSIALYNQPLKELSDDNDHSPISHY